MFVNIQHKARGDKRQTDFYHGGDEELANQRRHIGGGWGVFGNHQHEDSHCKQRSDDKCHSLTRVRRKDEGQKSEGRD